ncbi:MAG TPA: hypothetical protein VGM32_16665 [Rhodopila sp.]|jgi:hypothetical protein
MNPTSSGGAAPLAETGAFALGDELGAELGAAALGGEAAGAGDALP